MNGPNRETITVAITVDADAWALEYGLQPAEVRQDLRDWAVTTIMGAGRGSGVVIVEVTA